MPILSTRKREVFARVVARGSNYTRAAVVAGFSPRSARRQGSDRAKMPSVAGELPSSGGLKRSSSQSRFSTAPVRRSDFCPGCIGLHEHSILPDAQHE
jgi:hypothetical protein